MCMIEDADPATLYNARVVAHSRKPRKCDECQEDGTPAADRGDAPPLARDHRPDSINGGACLK